MTAPKPLTQAERQVAERRRRLAEKIAVPDGQQIIREVELSIRGISSQEAVSAAGANGEAKQEAVRAAGANGEPKQEAVSAAGANGEPRKPRREADER